MEKVKIVIYKVGSFLGNLWRNLDEDFKFIIGVITGVLVFIWTVCIMCMSLSDRNPSIYEADYVSKTCTNGIYTELYKKGDMIIRKTIDENGLYCRKED